MTLIKLDSGNLLNLEAVVYVDAEEGQAYFKSPVILLENDFYKKKLFSAKVTTADRDRIVEAMKEPKAPRFFLDTRDMPPLEINDLTRKQRGLSND